jgi:DNA-binding SARP family transcriptional activator/tetratricopeptide (TPR) repeat protein
VSELEARPGIRFHVLGTFECRVAGERVSVGSPQARRVLTVLLLTAGNTVPLPRLIQALWQEDPPGTAGHQVRKVISRLRQNLPEGQQLILTDGPGYRVNEALCSSDVAEFDKLLRSAGVARAEGTPGAEIGQLRAALDLWRGSVLDGEHSDVIRAVGTVLEERRANAAERMFELRLARGDAAPLISEIRGWVDEHPLRESLRRQLMVALYRAGRQADALAEFHGLRRLLAEQLGVDPGPELVSLYERILHADETLGRQVSAPSGPAPCTLPRDLPDFVGRADELDHLLGVASARSPGSGKVIWIEGMGGTGKTTLAVRAARQLAEAFPDGQLYVDVAGFTSGQRPLEATQVLEVLLSAFGVPAADMPAELAGRIVRWRSVIAGRRLLLVLDNTHDSARIASAIPPTGEYLVLVTSRIRLLDLDGAEVLSLGPLNDAECRELLAEVAGKRRVAAEPEACAELIRLCGGLPLAVRIAASRLRSRPHWSLAYLVRRLADTRRILRELAAGERDLASSLSLSYKLLEPGSQRAFRLLGLHPGRTIDAESAAALLGAAATDAEVELEHLLDMNLLQQHEAGRYELHDLVAAFARELQDDSTRREDTAAVQRLLVHYAWIAHAASELLFPGRQTIQMPAGAPAVRLTASAALHWFAAEYRLLEPLVAAGMASEFHWHVAALHRAFFSYLLQRGDQHPVLYETGQDAVRSARQAGDTVLLTLCLANLAIVSFETGKSAEGIDHLGEALDIARGTGDRVNQARLLTVTGTLHARLGRYTEALAFRKDALRIHLALEDANRRDMIETLIGISSVSCLLGRYAEARQHADEAVGLARALGSRRDEALALVNVARAALGLDDHDDALLLLGRAEGLLDGLDLPAFSALVQARFADACLSAGQIDEAYDHVRRAVTMVWEGGPAGRKATVANVMGRACRARGDYGEARLWHERAHDLAEQAQFHVEAAYALHGLGMVRQALAGPGAGDVELRTAQALFDSMGIPPAVPGARRLGYGGRHMPPGCSSDRAGRAARCRAFVFTRTPSRILLEGMESGRALFSPPCIPTESFAFPRLFPAGSLAGGNRCRRRKTREFWDTEANWQRGYSL